MFYEFEVPGKIRGKARPKVNTYTLRAYTPQETKDYEDLIQQYFIIKYPKYIPFEGRVLVKITACFPILKNTSKKNLSLMLANKISPTKKPDIDNIVKIVLDALNKIAFKDDNQITKLDVEKIYCTEEKVVIRVEEY